MKKKTNANLHGHSEQHFFTLCARNIILQVPEEQDDLLVNYGEEIGRAILDYLFITTKDNLEMIYQNKFKYRVIQLQNNVFNMKFDYLH